MNFQEPREQITIIIINNNNNVQIPLKYNGA